MKALRKLCLVSASLALAQGSFAIGGDPQRLGTGWRPATEAQVRAADRLVLKTRSQLPKRVLLTEFLPPVQSQGRQGSCTAWSTGYYLYSYALNRGRKVAPGRLGEPKAQVSPAFIYNQLNGGQDKGIHIADALKLLIAKGAASMEEMPYREDDFLRPPPANAFERALIDRAMGSYLLGQNTRFGIDEARQYLAEAKLPIVFGMPVFQSFDRMPSTPGYVYPGRLGPDDGPRGMHAMCVVGYDDDLRAFRVVNSWGPGWADNGFVWISYDHMAANARDDWTVVPGGMTARGSGTIAGFQVVRARS